ncbi:MAG: hypothetical protein ACJ75J_12005 [Cytophagaceae bacterium]
MKSIESVPKMMLVLFSIIFLSVSASMAQGVPGLYVHPAKNQTKDQQVKDEQSCNSWAQNESVANPTPQQKEKQHKTVKRTAVGAGAGALIGGGSGAAIGAGAGVISGRRSKKRDAKQSAATSSNDFVRAYSSCLRGKGYSVE